MAGNARATVLHLPQSTQMAGGRADFAEFSPGTLALYKYVAKVGPVQVDDAVRDLRMSYALVLEARAELFSLGLVRDGAHGLVAVPPAQAIDDLFKEQAEHLADTLEALRYRQARLRVLFDHRAQLHAGDETEISTVSLGDDAGDGPLSVHTEPQVSLSAIHPGTAYSPELLAMSLQRAERLGGRGIRLRVIHQASALAHPRLVSYLLSLQNSGVKVRVRNHLPARMLLIDERSAVCTLDHSEGAAQTFLLHGDKVVMLLARVFDTTWLDATPLDGALGGTTHPGTTHPGTTHPGTTRGGEAVAVDHQITGPAPVLTSVQASILKALADGQTDQAIARSLGITSRTVTRRVAEIYEVLGVESRFQAGIEARRLGLV